MPGEVKLGGGGRQDSESGERTISREYKCNCYTYLKINEQVDVTHSVTRYGFKRRARTKNRTIPGITGEKKSLLWKRNICTFSVYSLFLWYNKKAAYIVEEQGEEQEQTEEEEDNASENRQRNCRL